MPETRADYNGQRSLESTDNDIEYFFESQIRHEAQPVADYHFHPVESRAWRAHLTWKF